MITLILGLALCVLPAIIGFVVIQVRHRRSVLPFCLGAAAFVISQIVLRIPLIQVVLPRFGWYVSLYVNYPYVYWVFLGLTAGIFEETARWICFRFFLKRHRRFSDGIVFGLGHGGVEAILLVGITYLNQLIWEITLLGAGGVSQGLFVWDMLAGGVERVLALLMHVGFTMLVWYGVKTGRSILYLLAAILAHGFVDASIGFWQAAGIGGWALEGIFAVYVALLMGWVFWCKKKSETEQEQRSGEV